MFAWDTARKLMASPGPIGSETPASGVFTTLSVLNDISVGGTVDGRDIASDGSKLDELYSTIGLSALSSAEVDQLENIGATTISSAQWGYLGELDQTLKQAASPTFATAKLTNLSNGYLPYHVSDASGLANSPVYTDGTNVCIGGTSLETKLCVYSSSGSGILRVESGLGQGGLQLVSSGTYKPFINFGAGGTAGNLAAISYVVSDDYLRFDVQNETEAMVIEGNTGNLGLNTTTFGTNAAKVLGIGNGTAPTSSPADMVHMWAEDVSDSSELKARDEAGNTPTLTPHNFSLFEPSEDYYYPWSYYAKNPLLGREINVDMYGAISDLEKITKKKYIYTRDLPEEERESYEDWNRQREEHYLRKILEKADEVEVPIEDALEETEETVEVPDGHEIETRYQLEDGEVVKVEKAKPKRKEVPTGNVAYKLKEGIRFCEKTGKFYRKPALEELKYEPYQPKELPAWMTNIIKKQEQSTATQPEGFMQSFLNWAKKWLGVN